MFGSVDTTSFVRSYPKLHAEEIAELDFSKKKDKFGSWAWFDNGMCEIYEPQLTFYRTWGGIFRLRVDTNFAKLFNGSNILLPTASDIQDGLQFTVNNVKERTGLDYDAFKAEMCRVHYAFNQQSEIDGVKRTIGYYKNFIVPRMIRKVIEDESVYFENQSRGIRIYDKNAEICKNNPLPELIELSNGITRYEYFIDGSTPVKRFAKRMGFDGSTASEMLSEASISAAISELRMLLGYDNLNLTDQTAIEIIFEKTKDLKKARNLSSFLDAVKCFGSEFYRNGIYKTSRSTYYRNLSECQKLGLCA